MSVLTNNKTTMHVLLSVTFFYLVSFFGGFASGWGSAYIHEEIDKTQGGILVGFGVSISLLLYVVALILNWGSARRLIEESFQSHSWDDHKRKGSAL